VKYCVSQPLERYTSTDEPQQPTKTSNASIVNTVASDDTKQQLRKPKPTRRELLIAAFRRILLALGWQYDGKGWMHPDGCDLYPDHVPTLLKAITGLEVPGAIDTPCEANNQMAVNVANFDNLDQKEV
jgi:hypothetical protein